MSETQEIRTEGILGLALRAEPYYPEANKRILEYIRDVVKQGDEPGYVINDFEQALRSCMSHYGVQVMALTLRFVFENGFPYGDAYNMRYIGEALRDGKEDVLHRTISFLREQGSYPHMHFVTFLEGIDMYGEEEMLKGMNLAPYPLATDPYVPIEKYLDREYQWRRESYGRYTAHLGYIKVKSLYDMLFQEGVAAWQVGLLISHVASYDRNQERQRVCETELMTAIALIKEKDLSVNGCVRAVLEALHERQGTISEIRAVLTIAKSCGMEYLSTTTCDLENALHSYRQPGARRVAEEAAIKDKGFWFLNFKNAGLGLSIAIAAACGADIKAIMKGMYEETVDETNAVTQEILEKHYPKMGIFGAEKDLIAELANNPLIVPELWQKGGVRVISKSVIGQAERIHGPSCLRSVIRMAGEVAEFEVALAILKYHPDTLEAILASSPAESRPLVVRAANWHGAQKTRQSIQLVRDLDLDPQLILPIARGLSRKGSKLVAIRPDYWYKAATPEHHSQLVAFITRPQEERQVFGKAIKLYRRVHQTMWRRIITGRV